MVILGYDVWQRALGGRQDIVGSLVKLGSTPATVIGVMPMGFAYPINHGAWAPLSLRASYDALEGGAISVVGRLTPGVSQEQANAELRVLGERMAATLPETHQYLRPGVRGIAETSEAPDAGQYVLRSLPALLVLAIACLSVGTLVYARTATREGEIAVRSALGANRGRIMSQLFVEALVLASVAAAVGLIAADRAVTWGIEAVNRSSGGAPFWMTPGLTLSTMVYAFGLAIVTAAMLSVLPALKVTRARMQTHLANRSAGATLRFGGVWTAAMIAQVALTAIGIPAAMETANQAMLKLNIRAAFPSRQYLSARIDLDRPFHEEATPALDERRSQTFAALAHAVAQEPGVIAVTFADRAPGSLGSGRLGEVESPGAVPTYRDEFRTFAVGQGFLEILDRPIVAGRAFNSGDWNAGTRTVIVNEAFARAFSQNTRRGSPIGARLRYPGANQSDVASFEIVGVLRDVGLDPDDSGDEIPYVFHAASAGAMSPLMMTVRVRGNPAPLAARLPVVAADVDAGLLVREAQPLDAWIRQRGDGLTMQAFAFGGVTLLVLFLSALGIFSLVSVSVSRRTREIGLRTALGASSRHVLGGILSHAIILMGSGLVAGGALLMWAIALGLGPSGRPAEDASLFAGYLAMTSVVVIAASLLACIGPISRALSINPTEALRDA